MATQFTDFDNLVQLPKSPLQCSQDRIWKLEGEKRLLIRQLLICQTIFKVQGFVESAKELENTLTLVTEET